MAMREPPAPVLVDVRTPSEYARGHIPGAANIPLFTDEQRAFVGTCYKQQGQTAAIELGLSLVGAQMASFVQQARAIAPDGKLTIYCWRGGKRSSSMAWLFSLVGMEVGVLRGGYKAYRQYVAEAFDTTRLSLIVVGGKTGSGKSLVLRALAEQGEQIIDLEGLAQHKGSAFGALGQAPQPTTEHFENCLHQALRLLDPTRRVWVENESRKVGTCFIPAGFWEQKTTAPIFQIALPHAVRLQHLLDEYGTYPAEQLIAAFAKIQKHLAGQFAALSTQLAQGELEMPAATALRYYDKAYQHSWENSQARYKHSFSFAVINPAAMAQTFLQWLSENPMP